MATTRPFAYNPTQATISGTTNYGTLCVGDSAQDYSIKPGGLTWWMGPDEDLGYVIAKDFPGSNYPTQLGNIGTVFFRRCAKNDTAFINTVSYISGSTQATVNDALTWLTSNGYWTSYSPIVTANLVLHLDAGNSSSYPGSGSTWTDLIASRTFTLFNSPAYSSSSGGYLTFSKSSSQYATCTNIGSKSTWTLEAWVRFNSSLTGQVGMIVGNQYNGASSLNFTIGTNGAPGSYNIQSGFFNGAWRNTAGFAPTLNTWYQIVGTYDGTTIRQYANGSASGGTLTYTGTPTSGGEIRLMRRWDDVVTSSNLIDGDLAVVRIYDGALSSSDVLQNFNAQKTRFGL